jgi:hypothetical protein
MATRTERFPKKCFNAEVVKASGPLVLEIEEERLEEITDPNTGRTAAKSVITFVGTEQILVLNVTNWELIEKITGNRNSKNWPGYKIELYTDKTNVKGKRVDCVRVRAPSNGRPALADTGEPAFGTPRALSTSPLTSAAASPSSPPADERPVFGGPPMDDEIPF